jgi:hypothetical protein
MSEPDSLEGFNIIDYDEKTKTVTIELHPALLTNPKSQQAMVEKCIEMMTSGPNVDAVTIVPRG